MKLIDPVKLAIITLWQEARGEPFDGKVAVAEVIRTRMLRKFFSDGTIEGTVLRAKQFSGWNPGDPNRIISVRLDDEDTAVKDCQKAWEVSERTALTKGADHYVNLSIVRPPWFDDAKVTAVIGNHTFLRLH